METLMWLAMAALLLWLGSYAVLCAVQPFARCRRCQGAGEITRFGKQRTCPRCLGDKLRLRVGRRLHNAWRRTHEAGAR
jgi:DnaJ-class molecular chaperone